MLRNQCFTRVLLFNSGQLNLKLSYQVWGFKMASESAALGNGQNNEVDSANMGEGDVPSTYRRILVGMDGTADAQKAFDWYMDNIRQPDDFVYVGYCPAAGSLFNCKYF
uniref:UspA domain-containing protein n=1 Tax=Biomphalaria glabrata TaxID=6526 RepID=A0A2C9LYK4_BIOGL